MYEGQSAFQFTPLREGRPADGAAPSAASIISIHAPPRGATCGEITVYRHKSISIHAPPRGATVRKIKTIDDPDISIHAPPRGATFRQHLEHHRRIYFNSRPSARGDADAQSVQESADISIHAPPRGATNLTVGSSTDYTFQFTPLREGRLPTSSEIPASPYFNSRPSARGDPQIIQPATEQANFNSRPSARGDRSEKFEANSLYISIHAPPRGATTPAATLPAIEIFQFTPLREGRPEG